MGYEIYYNPVTKTWSIYSTISMGFIYSGLKSPEEAASKIIKGSWFVSVDGGNWITFVTEEEAKAQYDKYNKSYPGRVKIYEDKVKAEKVFLDWVMEARVAQRDKKEYVEYIEFPTGRIGVKKAP